MIGVCSLSLYDTYLCALYGVIGSIIDSIMGIYLQSYQYVRNNNKSHHIDPTHISNPTLPLSDIEWKRYNNIINTASALATSILAVTCVYIKYYYHIDMEGILWHCAIHILFLLLVFPSSILTLLSTALVTLLWYYLFYTQLWQLYYISIICSYTVCWCLKPVITYVDQKDKN